MMRQPSENNIMKRCPRDPKDKLLTASFGSYFTVLANNPANAPVARSMGLAVIMLANLFLVQVNSFDNDSIFQSVRRLMKDRVMWTVNLGTLVLLSLILYTPLSGVLKLAALPLPLLLIVLGLSAASVLWYELVKLKKRLSLKR